MAAFWFYRPRRLIERALSKIRNESWSHVGIQHAVSDVSVLTESDPTRGVWCLPVSKVVPADDAIHVDIPDDFLTTWLMQRWGVRYGWLSSVVSAVPSYISNGRLGVRPGELVYRLIVDAAAAGITVPGGDSVILYKLNRVDHIYHMLYANRPR